MGGSCIHIAGLTLALRGCRLTPRLLLCLCGSLALFLCGPPVGDSATPSRSGGRAPCRNKAFSSRSRPKTHSGDAWRRWVSVLFSLFLRLGFALFSGLPFSVSVRFVSFRFVSFRFRSPRLASLRSLPPEQGWSHCKSSTPRPWL